MDMAGIDVMAIQELHGLWPAWRCLSCREGVPERAAETEIQCTCTIAFLLWEPQPHPTPSSAALRAPPQVNVSSQNPKTVDMNPPHVCRACRLRLSYLRPRPRTPLQWQPRAYFISLAGEGPRTTTGDRLKDDLLDLGDSRGQEIKPETIQPDRIRGSGPERRRPGDMLESLFEDIRTQSASISKASQHSELPDNKLEVYMKAVELKNMLSGSDPLVDSWHYFLQYFGPNNELGTSLDKKLPSYLNTAAKELLRKLIRAKKQDPKTERLPSVTDISKVYSQLGMLSGREWSEMVTDLLVSLLETASPERLMLDLLGAWNVVCRGPEDIHGSLPTGTMALDWKHLPEVTPAKAIERLRMGGAKLAFGLLTPTFPEGNLIDIPALAIVTFGLFACDPAPSQAGRNAAPFLALVSYIIRTPGLSVNQLFDKTTQKNPLFSVYLQQHFNTIRAKAREISLAQSPSLAQSHRNTNHSPSNRNPSSFIRNSSIPYLQYKLKAAFNRKNLFQVDKVWAKVSAWPVVSVNSGEDHLQDETLSEQDFEYLIMVYMSLRQPSRAIEVWNHMVKNGLSPTLETWNSMLAGCKAGRDGKGIEDVWRRMLDAGVYPDIFCWTTRISGLFRAREIDAGIAALDNMGQSWLTAAKAMKPTATFEELRQMGDIGHAIKPSISTVNAAIDGLLKWQADAAAHRILAWATKFGISPDVTTFNTLLKPLCRRGKMDEAMLVLRQMQQAGIEADVATFTTILDETFRFTGDLPPEEQKKVVDNVFAEMEKSGVKPNSHTYGKIIYSLLHSNGDTKTANLVMDRMVHEGIEPSPQIFTTLLEYYLEKDPPDLDAVRQIIERAELVIRGTDFVFWDRAIEGYARVGQTTQALRILGELRGAHNKVGWDALLTLLYALSQNQEWELAKTLVKNAIIDSGGPIAANARGTQGQHNFWKMAGELGLLNAELYRSE